MLQVMRNQYGGYKVWPSHYHPIKFCGWKNIWGISVIKLLDRTFPRLSLKLKLRSRFGRWEDGDIIIDKLGMNIYCSHAQFEVIKKAIP